MSAKFPRGGEQTHSQPSVYKESASLSNILHSTINFSSSHNIIRSDEAQSKSLLLIIENCLPFTDDAESALNMMHDVVKL